MNAAYREKRNCGDCGAKPGEYHDPGCDVERCALCGGQVISCDCVYEVCGIDVATMEEKHPDIYHKGPNARMQAQYLKAVEKYGGLLPWTGYWPGYEECVEFGWWCRRNPRGPGYVPCDRDHPEAGPDLNRLATDAVWCREKRRFVLPGKALTKPKSSV